MMGLPTNQANNHSDKKQHLQQCKPAVMEENEAKRIIASQSLSSLKLGDFLVVTNSDFDLTISCTYALLQSEVWQIPGEDMEPDRGSWLGFQRQ